MSAARQRIRAPLMELLERLRGRYPRLPIDTGLVHALRQFGVQCYELGGSEVHAQTTLPAPGRAPTDMENEVTGSYSLVDPDTEDR